MDKPKIPTVVCGRCGSHLYWCGVHEDWVDRLHRKSHHDDNHRVKHSPTQPERT